MAVRFPRGSWSVPFPSFLSFPISETDNVRAGLGISSNKINLSYQYLTTDANGNPITETANYSPQVLIDYQNAIGHQTIHTWDATLGWTHDTRNGYWAPTRGGKLSVSADVALPGSTVQYWKVTAEANHYWPIGKGFVLFLDGQVGDGQTYGKNGIDECVDELGERHLFQRAAHRLFERINAANPPALTGTNSQSCHRLQRIDHTSRFERQRVEMLLHLAGKL